MITKKKYGILIVFLSVTLFSCSSSNSGNSKAVQQKDGSLIDSQGRKLDTRTGRIVHVEVVDSKERGGLVENKKQKAQKEYLEIFKNKKQWSKM